MEMDLSQRHHRFDSFFCHLDRELGQILYLDNRIIRGYQFNFLWGLPEHCSLHELKENKMFKNFYSEIISIA